MSMYYTPTKVIFGKGTEMQAGQLIKEQKCKKVLIHYGGGSVKRSGLLDRVKASLEEAGVDYIELGGAVPNPQLSLVYEGIELVKKEDVDFILAVGGGSAIDSAKGIAFGAANEGDVWDFYTGVREPEAILPVACILTIAAAGSEMSKSTVISKGDIKRACDVDLARPVFAIMNPELTMTLPDYQTACGCVDIMMHTMERYFDNSEHMDIVDVLSEDIMKNVMKYALILAKDPMNYEARAEIMWTGSLAHNGLTEFGTNGGEWATHLLEHEIGGLFDVAHGAGLAAVWGSWARYVWKNTPDRFVKFAVNVMDIEPKATDEETVEAGICAVEDFYRAIKMPTSIRELGIDPTDEDIERMAASCSGRFTAGIGSVRKLMKEDMIAIYKAAL